MTVDLDKLEELARAATPGPWDNHSINGDPIESVWLADGSVVATWAIKEPRFEFHAPQAREDAAFIAAARNAIPELVERVRAAAARGDHLTAWVEQQSVRARLALLEAIVRDLAMLDLVDDAYELKALQRRAVEAKP